MTKDKYDFIQELLQNQKLPPAQRERILLLVTNEFKKDNIQGIDNSARIERIENELGLLIRKINPTNKAGSSEISSNDLIEFEQGLIIVSDFSTTADINSDNPKLPLEQINKGKKKLIAANPKHVADFMSLFNQREGLKYLTHDFDDGDNFDIEAFLIRAKVVFENSTKKLSIPSQLWQIVNQFGFKNEPKWTAISETYDNKTVKDGWQNWAQLKGNSHLHPFRISQSNAVINDFRRITRVESSPNKESPNFEKLIDKCIETAFKEDANDFEIEKFDLAKADFYTHVGNLKIAIETIFDEIKRWADSDDKRKLSIKYERKTSDDYFLRKIIITHHNSFPTKELRLLLMEWKQKGNMGKINEKLNGYCHWSVETKVEGTPVRINILKENIDTDSEEIETAIGFSHILTFYYK